MLRIARMAGLGKLHRSDWQAGQNPFWAVSNYAYLEQKPCLHQRHINPRIQIWRSVCRQMMVNVGDMRGWKCCGNESLLAK
jgi:hypothetical protein